MNRRNFLKNSLLTAAALASLPGCTTITASRKTATSQARVIGANEAIRVAVVGLNGRGQAHLESYRRLPGVRVVALCDVDRNVLDLNLRLAKEKGEDVAGFTDYRDLLERGQVDAVSLATPNHWHSLGANWGVQAGKHVYVEKPVSHNVFEGQQLVAAERKYGRLIQCGTQLRSIDSFRAAVSWIQAGNLGRIIRARGLCYKYRPSIGKVVGVPPVPASVDFNLWAGPAPLKAPHRQKFHYDWHWFWDTGNGDLGNQGVHQMDIARWVLGYQALPPAALSIGGRLGYEDDGETPNTQFVFFDYQPAPIVFEVRGLPEKAGATALSDYRGATVGVIVDCEGGYVSISGWKNPAAYDTTGKEIPTAFGSADSEDKPSGTVRTGTATGLTASAEDKHFENFLAAIRSGSPGGLRARPIEGHLSAAMCHLANISYRLGHTGSPDAIRAAVKDNAELTEMLGRTEEHLAANQVDLLKSPLTLGALLKMDVKTEKFVGNQAANQMLTRPYRKPFVVPEIA